MRFVAEVVERLDFSLSLTFIQPLNDPCNRASFIDQPA